jgi:hypothetical protein
MKSIFYILIAALFLGCDDSNEEIDVKESLSQLEIEDLQFLKEEEKLARDVYLYSYDLYNHRIFENISNSEQSHMNSVTVIMEKYDVEDLSFEERGKFSNSILQKLYNDLVSISKNSLEDALVVGATVEDLDINDLDIFVGETFHEDIADMYGILNCGSRNHLRSYISNLENRGVTYDPQFVSLEEYNEILSGAHEQCNN